MKTFEEWSFETIVCESSLSRMLSKVGDGTGSISNPFAIITAYRKLNSTDSPRAGLPRTRSENISYNRELRGSLNNLKLGIHQLIGHWQECQDGSIPYKDCPSNMKIDVIERSYFVSKNNELSQDEFEELMINLGNKYKQDAIILSDGTNVRAVYMGGGQDVIGTKIGLNQIAQGYSQHVLKQNVPFRFEGFEQFHGNIARQGAFVSGLKLPSINEDFKIIKAKSIN